MTSYLLVVNPTSGRGRASGKAEALRRGLAESSDVHVLETRGRGFASEAVFERAHEFDRIIAIGGDGTLNEVLTGLMSVGAGPADLPALGFLPSGTANAAVRAFGFGTEPDAVARLLPEAEVRRVDVGVVSYGERERPFLLWFGAGYDAVVIRALHERRTGFMGVAGLLRNSPSVVRAVHRYAAPEISILSDAHGTRRVASVMLVNVSEMAFGWTAAEGADPFDGHLDLVAVPRARTVGVFRHWLRTMTSSLDRAPGVARWTTRSVRLEAEGEVPFQLDGEPVGTLPVEVRVEPGAVPLLMT